MWIVGSVGFLRNLRRAVGRVLLVRVEGVVVVVGRHGVGLILLVDCGLNERRKLIAKDQGKDREIRYHCIIERRLWLNVSHSQPRMDRNGKADVSRQQRMGQG